MTETWHEMLARHHKEKLDRVMAAIGQGLTAPEAAEKLGCTPDVLHGFCNNNGICWPRKTERDTPRYKRRARMCAAGMRIGEIAKIEGVKRDSMRQYLKGYGILQRGTA